MRNGHFALRLGQALLPLMATQRYDEALARSYGELVEAALCTDDRILTWQCGSFCEAGRIINGSQELLGPSDNYHVRGYVAITSAGTDLKGLERHCVIAFPGTSFYDLSNIGADAEPWLEAWPNFRPAATCADSSKWCPGCKVMHGFAGAYAELRVQMLLALEKLECSHVALAGHSLGGGLATLASMELRSCWSENVDVTGVWTFGMPRLGNAEFADAYAEMAALRGHYPPQWRVVHHRDLIPRVPLYRLGYRHVPVEVFYDRKVSSTAQICAPVGAPHEEDLRCSASFCSALPVMPWSKARKCSMKDHNDYLPGLSFDENDQPDTCISKNTFVLKQQTARHWLLLLASEGCFGVASILLCCFCCWCCCCKRRKTHPKDCEDLILSEEPDEDLFDRAPPNITVEQSDKDCSEAEELWKLTAPVTSAMLDGDEVPPL
eukprot:TRINITY_DN98562_c0_g1_i1.p1 TRINITY_DN98562_c0_g1~~TRINITY_DN98562_c0_g1_i1.p1  ORF type:complete len:436 (+),score=83.76 TRINITY_DN98562_c0_g1_i1:82-1389(+)